MPMKDGTRKDLWIILFIVLQHLLFNRKNISYKQALYF